MVDNLSVAPNGKYNFEGANLSEVIFVDVPYQLLSIIVLSLPQLPKTCELRIVLSDAAGTVLSESTIKAAIPPAPPDRYMPLAQPMNLRVEGPGHLRVDLDCEYDKFSQVWEIKVGAAPSGRADFRSQHVLDANASGPTTVAEGVLAAATRSLDVADQYLDRASALRLFKASGVRSTTKVRLLVSHDKLSTFHSGMREVRRPFPDFEVRAGRRIHDRFVIGNGSEVHVFGGSLKDLNRGRVSFAVRVTDAEAWKQILAIFENEWDSAAGTRVV